VKTDTLIAKLLFIDKMIYFQHWLFFLFVIGLTFPSKTQDILLPHINSQTINALDSTNLISSPLNEVVVTGQINAAKVSESINNILIIGRREIAETASNNLGDVLTHHALFDLEVDPFLGTSLSMQGIQGNNINILIDGVPIIGRKGTQIDISQINLSSIDRIEILKGPGSVAYGTNSTGGVVNLISKQNLKNQIGLETYMESIGVAKIFLDFDRDFLENKIHFNFGNYHFTGSGDETMRSQDWRSKNQYFGDFHWKRSIKNIEFFFKKSFFSELIIDLGEENFFPFQGTAIDQHYLTYRDNNYLKLKSLSDDQYNWSSIFSFSKTRFTNEQYNVNLELDSSVQTDDEQYNTEDVFKSMYNRSEFNYFDWDKIKLQIGFDFNYDYVEGSRIEDNGVEIFSFSVFSQTNLKISNFIESQFGLRIPYHSIYESSFIPSFNLKFDVTSKLKLRLSCAKGFRAPSAKELFMEFIDVNHNILGNSNLDSETSNSFQSSINYIFSQNQKNVITLDIETFLSDLKNKIALAQIENSDVYTYYNLNDAKYYGVNSSLRAKFNINSDILTTINFIWNIYTINNQDFDYKTPKQNISASYVYEYLHCNCGLNINWKLKSSYEFQSLDEENQFNTYQQDGYQLLNFSIFKRFPMINSSFRLGVKNLFDITELNYATQDLSHPSSVNTISWGRTYFIQLKWSPF
tara:strand:+ start:41597 stop:43672 length:2076 start_codon:yes stop_codon:yes gene_type:complete